MNIRKEQYVLVNINSKQGLCSHRDREVKEHNLKS